MRNKKFNNLITPNLASDMKSSFKERKNIRQREETVYKEKKEDEIK
jgi:hypothetical protein